MASGDGCSCLGAATSRVEWIDQAVDDAVRLARLAPGRQAVVVVVQPAELPEDPASAMMAASDRCFFSESSGWMLAEGIADQVVGSGPDRFAQISRHHAARQQLTVVAAPRGGAEQVRWLLAATFSELAPKPGEWGAAMPATRLWLPRRVRWRTDGSGWDIRALVVGAEDDPGQAAARLMMDPSPSAKPSAKSWSVLPDSYTDRVEDAVELIRDLAMKKVVLARAVDEPIVAADRTVFERLRAGAGTAYWLDLDDGGAFAGRTPELLMECEGDRVRTMALAGTCAASDDPAELLASTKQRKEHGLVVEHLVAALRPRCLPFAVPGQPGLRRLGALIHLETLVEASVLRGDWLDLVAALHPTPAVCGLPAATAAHWLRRREGLERGLYAGVLGWISASACRLVVPLRGAVLAGDRSCARLYAGAGIVETSDPESELAETELKLGAMRAVLCR